MKTLPAAVLLAACLSAAPARADVAPNPLFGDGAVLQRDTEVPVWGTATREGEKVAVSLDGQPAVVAAAKDGKWMVKLPAQKAGGPHTLKIAGDNTVELKDVLFGEVWICSGQSNMEMNLKPKPNIQAIPGAERIAGETARAGLRLFHVKRALSLEPLGRVSGKWERATPESASSFSFVGQCFGSALKKALGDGVPVGLIEADWGGTPAEAWTSRAGMGRTPALAAALGKHDAEVKAHAENPEKLKAERKAVLAKHAEAVAKAKAENRPAPWEPRTALPPAENPTAPTVLHNGMIAPLVPYAFRGVVWYQGESNGGRAKEYRTTFPNLIADWRGAWGRGDFPFLFVQIAPFKGMGPEIREAQFLALAAAPNTAMVQTLDVGDANDVHPVDKEPVGRRLALAARRLAYGEAALEYSGPLFAGASFEGGKAVVSFTHADAGLELKGVKDGDFQLAGADKKFHPATAVVEGRKLVVSAPEVAQPAAVRYGWSNVPNPALWNKDGLPASPFRSDVD